MTARADDNRKRALESAFKMPAVQTMTSRKSSITNAFVNAVIPVISPTLQQIEEALAILQIDPFEMRCTYCGRPSTEWDHLRPLVRDRRPTGYVSEITNLVPACGKCNQSKGNKDWRDWMLSNAKWCPNGRGVADIPERMKRLEEYEKWQRPLRVDFRALVGIEEWDSYWASCEAVIDEMRECQVVANAIRDRVRDALKIR